MTRPSDLKRGKNMNENNPKEINIADINLNTGSIVFNSVVRKKIGDKGIFNYIIHNSINPIGHLYILIKNDDLIVDYINETQFAKIKFDFSKYFNMATLIVVTWDITKEINLYINGKFKEKDIIKKFRD